VQAVLVQSSEKGKMRPSIHPHPQEVQIHAQAQAEREKDNAVGIGAFLFFTSNPKEEEEKTFSPKNGEENFTVSAAYRASRCWVK